MTYKVVLYPRLMLKGLSRKTRGEREGIPQKAAFPASTCEDGYKYLRGGLHVLARTDARTCRDGCTYLQGRMQVRARTDASTCEEGCKYVRGGMQCTARRDAVHCRGGCSALQGRLQCTASEMGKTGSEIVKSYSGQEKREERLTPYGSL